MFKITKSRVMLFFLVLISYNFGKAMEMGSLELKKRRNPLEKDIYKIKILKISNNALRKMISQKRDIDISEFSDGGFLDIIVAITEPFISEVIVTDDNFFASDAFDLSYEKIERKATVGEIKRGKAQGGKIRIDLAHGKSITNISLQQILLQCPLQDDLIFIDEVTIHVIERDNNLIEIEFLSSNKKHVYDLTNKKFV